MTSNKPNHRLTKLRGLKSPTRAAAGNMTNDGLYSYTYNAEGQQTSAAGVTYTYDGDGQPVKKLALSGVEGSNGKLYWFGLGGVVLAETDLSGNNPTEHIYFGGQRVARRDSSGTVYYSFADHLGTARIITDSTGPIKRGMDFQPFGFEVVQQVATAPVLCRGLFAPTHARTHGIKSMPWLQGVMGVCAQGENLADWG